MRISDLSSDVCSSDLPGVGRDYCGWRWAVGASLSLPLAALAACIADGHAAMEAARQDFGLRCLLQGVASGLGVGAALFFWLKAGAPTSPTRAGWVIGIAAGAAGRSEEHTSELQSLMRLSYPVFC